MTFTKEVEFENAIIKVLTESCGWSHEVLEYKTEAELIDNWAKILFENNRQVDRLNDYPLTRSEMQQIIEQINALKTPHRLNSFINGRSVSIKRDNPDDKEHLGKEVSLKIYDRYEIASGNSRYQIARQPVFKAKTDILPDRRGDFMLLINGMPLIHVELKKSGVPVSKAYNQIEKYSKEGVFTDLFGLVQVFVAMNPEEAVYFANPGMDGKFNTDFYFHWADFNNEPINDWKTVASSLLSIPMAHQLIGFYTVADDTDGILKVMRSYQYCAANKISDTVAKHKWEEGNQLGGYIWHTTGSGKTMTSFKSAQLIANSKDAEKVVFLIDRIELGTQSAIEYRNFADEKESIQETEDTITLVNKLKSTSSADTLIVTSIQKMSILCDEEATYFKQADLDAVTKKKIVFIVDECHRSSFGLMMHSVKQTFKSALFFGFSGTPIHLENKVKGNTTSDVFGNELHRYSIADGIRDKNVLGFDPYMVLTFKEKDAREAVALSEAKASSTAEVFLDKKKEKIYYHFMNEVPMATSYLKDGKKVKGIEDYLLESGQYRTEEHRNMVVEDILDNWLTISRNNKFHGIFATSSIPEACSYYRMFKEKAPDLNVTVLVDPTVDNDEAGIAKEESLIEIVSDYNAKYKMSYSLSDYPKMKKDIQLRLAHKKPYERIEINHDECIDLLIVVNQLLTGYDSKWLNVLYLDKILKYENIIQAFSRTNRLFGPDKRFGTIKYYRAPYTMKNNIENAVKLYSGDKALGLFAIKLDKNLENMNNTFNIIKTVFEQAGVSGFSKLPEDYSEKKKFAKLFREFNEYLDAALVQGFTWKKLGYNFVKEDGKKYSITLALDEKTYKVLALRYKELFNETDANNNNDIPYDLAGYLTTIDTDEIDADYMNSRFQKYLKALTESSEKLAEAKEELHTTFATLSQEKQKYANVFLHDIESGDVKYIEGMSFIDYVNQYEKTAHNDQIHRISEALGLDEEKLRNIMALNVTEKNINEFGRYEALKATIDKNKAKAYFEKIEGKELILPIVNMKADKLLWDFILKGGIEVD